MLKTRTVLVVLALAISLAGEIRRGYCDSNYCGIYAVYGAAQVLGKAGPEFEDLVDVKYISDLRGSTALDLIDALELYGIHGEYVSNLGEPSLNRVSGPMILHVASEGQLNDLNHWCLLTKVSNNTASVVLDSGGEIEMELPLLLARWKGDAILLDPASAQKARWAEWMFVICVMSIGFTVAFCGRFCFLPSGDRRSPAREGLVLVTVFAMSVGYSTFRPASPATAKNANAYIRAAFNTGQFPEVTTTELESHLASGDSIVIDVRPYHFYALGSIPGSISIPSQLDSQALAAHCKSIPVNAQVILYCKSKACGFDEMMAIRLAALGYENIRLYTGGWDEWDSMH